MTRLEVDIGGALSEAAVPGVSREALTRLDDRVGTVHQQMLDKQADGAFGYQALSLPETVDTAAIEEQADRFAGAEAVLVAGIGGSALGAAAIGAVADAPIYTLDNIDPAYVRRVLETVPLADTVLVGVSRSGTTTETLANFLVAREAFGDAGVDWTSRTVVVTGDEGPLAAVADEHDLPRLPVPTGVPGRFAVLSPVGLVPAAIAGVDITALVAGARHGQESRSDSLFETPAYAYGATAYALGIRGAAVTAMMPYAEALGAFSEWFAQLWAESLGKDGLGQVPTSAMGVTDQHSQLQLYRSGPRNLAVTVVGADNWPSVPVPEPSHPELSYLADEDLGSILETERRATVGSLHAADRPVIEVNLPDLSIETLGELLYTMEAACILTGELYGLNPFSQPAVEWAKRATRGLLRDVTTAETQMITERSHLRVATVDPDD